MRSGNYALEIVGGQEQEGGLVGLRHGQQYGLRFTSYVGEQTDVEVEIDGKMIGGWRLYGHQVVTLERPQDSQERFTFYKTTSSEGAAIGLQQMDAMDRGLIRVRFYPAVNRPQVSYGAAAAALPVNESWHGGQSVTFGGTPRTRSGDTKGLTSGGTGLSGHSNQRYGKAAPIERDTARMVEIVLRLGALPDGPKRLQALRSIPDVLPD